MRKLALVTVITLNLFLLTCVIDSLFGFDLPTPTALSEHHISRLTLYGSDLYFGAGYCLYRLDTQDQTLYEIVCRRDWTFQRPAIDGERAYAQVLTSLEGKQFFVAVDLSTGATVWRVNEGWPPDAFFGGTKQYTFLINGRVVTAQREGVDVFNTQSGHRMWHSGHNWMDGVIPFVVHGDSVWYPIHREDSAEDGGVVAVELDTGDIQQTINLLPEARFEQLLYVDDRWILGLDHRFDPLVVFAVDRARPGEVRWSRELALQTRVTQSILYGELFIFAAWETVYALDVYSGQVAWIFEPNIEPVPAENSEQAIFFVLPRRGQEGSTLYALDAMSGIMIWQYTLQSTCTMPVASKTAVYVANKDSIDAIDLKTGQLLWQVSVDSLYEFYPDLP